MTYITLPPSPPAVIIDVESFELVNQAQKESQEIAKGVVDLLKKKEDEFDYSEDPDKIEMLADPPNPLDELYSIDNTDHTPTDVTGDIDEDIADPIEQTPTIIWSFDIMGDSYRVLKGTVLEKNSIPSILPNDFTIPGEFRGNAKPLSLNKDLLSRHMLFIGSTGSGKTNALNFFLQDIKSKMTEHDVMIVFDTKGDFEDKFFDKSKDVVIGNSPRYRKRSELWNIFEDIVADGWDEEDYLINLNEISASLFKKYESESQPFFALAARGVFSAVLLNYIRKKSWLINGKIPHDGIEKAKAFFAKNFNNAGIVDCFNNATIKDYHNIAKTFPDLIKLKSYLGDGNNNQGLGVLAEVHVMMQDMLLGVFDKKGNFSIRNFVRQKGARTLFLEYDMSIGETLTPLYSLLMDLALKEALGRSEDEGKKGSVYVILDEMKLLPQILHLDDAVNFGRSMGVKIIAGLQSLTQIYDIYGAGGSHDKGDAILSGFGSVVSFRPNDCVTREYVQNRFGRNMLNEEFDCGHEVVYERRQGFCVEDWDLNKLGLGQAVVALGENPPFMYKFNKY